MAKADLSAQRLRELLHYAPDTGAFSWAVARGSVPAGKSTGFRAKNGYVQIGIDGALQYAHRLAWLHHYGAWPVGVIDHINGDRADNRLANLRDVPVKHNTQNVRSPQRNSTTGFLGVVRKRGRFRAQIGAHGTCICLGDFDTPEEAHAAYVAAKRIHHPGGLL